MKPLTLMPGMPDHPLVVSIRCCSTFNKVLLPTDATANTATAAESLTVICITCRPHGRLCCMTDGHTHCSRFARYVSSADLVQTTAHAERAS